MMEKYKKKTHKWQYQNKDPVTGYIQTYRCENYQELRRTPKGFSLISGNMAAEVLPTLNLGASKPFDQPKMTLGASKQHEGTITVDVFRPRAPMSDLYQPVIPRHHKYIPVTVNNDQEYMYQPDSQSHVYISKDGNSRCSVDSNVTANNDFLLKSQNPGSMIESILKNLSTTQE